MDCAVLYTVQVSSSYTTTSVHMFKHIGALLEIYIRWEETPVTRRETH